MNLFFKRLFGLMESTDKMEAKDNQLFADYIHYKRFEASDEYAEYKRLFEVVKSADFKEKRKALKTRKYSDTQEYRDMEAFEKYDSDSDLRLYFKTLDSKELKDYIEFKDTDEYYKLSDADEVSKSAKLEEYKIFEHSKEYKNYARFHNSFAAKEYIRLKELVASDEFKKNNEFWADPNRWETTEEYQTECRFYEIADSEAGRFFFSTDPEKFKRIENMVVYRKDLFDYKKLDGSAWSPGFFYNGESLKRIHSFTKEQQANMGGKNITLGNGMTISTKNEKATALAWDEKCGFVEKEFQFTSDVVNGHSLVEDQEYSGIRVKMRCNGNINHAFWLSSGNKIPQINVALIKGKTIEVGVYDARGDYYYTTIKGINPAKYHLYTLYQKDDALIWKINNIEVFRTKNIIAGQRFFPSFNSFIPNNKKNASEGNLDIAWVETYNQN
ncbi:MAG: hypothetical protein CSA89_01500 [Bacteroidales bacterium]|nr:MAG: hypothetical protein CSA89_01500 [Bacteroidales bacterium]